MANTSNITSIYNVFVAVAHDCKCYRPDQKNPPGRTVGGSCYCLGAYIDLIDDYKYSQPLPTGRDRYIFYMSVIQIEKQV